MLNFNKIDVNNLNDISSYINIRKNNMSELSLGFTLMWYEYINICYAIYNDTIIFKAEIGEGDLFSFPMGKDIDGALNELIEYAKLGNIPVRISALNLDDISYLNNKFKNNKYSYDINFSDYVYSFSDHLNFKGKKFSGQRNHINKFIKTYGIPNIRLINDNDIDNIMQMLNQYEIEHNIKSILEKKELEGTKKLILDRNPNLIYACLTLDNKIIAISIAEIINNMLIIHVEKALFGYSGIYPTMYNGFLKLINNLGKKIDYINREDDAGDIGIRTSKLQYHPIDRIHKYIIHINTPIDNIKDEIKVNDIILSKICENDIDDYYNLNTDLENNKYYGYDYRDDLYLVNPITKNTFYDRMCFDYNIGDSISFGIRLNNKLIGETIFWHFSYNNYVEIGIRLFKEYQGLGHSKLAFSAMKDYAISLGLIPIARCYKENIKSYNMITSSGFNKIKSDDTFYYFSI